MIAVGDYVQGLEMSQYRMPSGVCAMGLGDLIGASLRPCACAALYPLLSLLRRCSVLFAHDHCVLGFVAAVKNNEICTPNSAGIEVAGSGFVAANHFIHCSQEGLCVRSVLCAVCRAQCESDIDGILKSQCVV